jgi:predicted O-linked N-acetylglucosamine transferase (SPINDLY family)
MNARAESPELSSEAGGQDRAFPDRDDLGSLAKQGLMPLGDLLSFSEQLQKMGLVQEACRLYELWLAGPSVRQRHLALFNYGSLVQTLGRTDEALAAYEGCLALDRRFAHAWINLGLVRERRGEHEHALDAWSQVYAQRFVEQAPPLDLQVMALNHIGRLQEQLRRYPQAQEALEASLAINPNQAGVIQHWIHIRQKSCDWPVYKKLPHISLADMLHATSPLAMLALTDDPVQQLSTARAFVARTYPFKEERLHPDKPYGHAKTRLGYVSADFREHAVGFLLPAFFESHDRSRYELFAYDYSKEEVTTTRQRIRGQFDHFRSINQMSDRQAAELIAADEIDILVDLHGLSSGARPGIFALHPAPRQGTYLGFIGSTAMPWFDFVLADPQVLPPHLATHFTEKPIYLEGCFLPEAEQPEISSAPCRQELGLPVDAFVMAAFGNVYKITPDMFGTWLNLLRRIPSSVLWLIDDNPATTGNLREHARRAGIKEGRLIFSARSSHPEFCARLKLADVFLDTYPYNCGSTARDVVAAGVPLVSLYGQTMVSRMGLSLLSFTGQQENAVATFSEYKERVIGLYNRPPQSRTPGRSGMAASASVDSALRQFAESEAQKLEFELDKLLMKKRVSMDF